MDKSPNYIRLAGSTGVLCLLSAAAAHAAAITGQVGVGTWNTQAEFADVKVVQGTKTLYQSAFLSKGLQGWTTSGGGWSSSGGYLRQTGTAAPALASVGSTTWSNYTLTLRARKTGGAEGFLISFGSPSHGTKTWWNIGGWGNSKHALEVPGVSAPEVPGSIQTGVWYDIRVELQSNNVKCYLNGALVHDTTRMLDLAERDARVQQMRSSPGFALLNAEEQGQFNELFGRSVYLGAAARATFNSMPSSASFAALSAAQQAAIIRKVNRNRTTWNRGYGFGSDAWRDNTITDSMDRAVMIYNANGLFDKHVTANNDPGVPTADANYDGWMRFGSQLSYRTALHEMGHCMGVGTYWRWPQLMTDGNWDGYYANNQIEQFDGTGAVVLGDGMHFWPYGLNQESELTYDADRRHVLIVAALRRDMGIHTFQNTVYTTEVPSGTYRLTPRHATGSSLNVRDGNPANGTNTDITSYAALSQQHFLFDLQSDGTYRIRTALAGNRCVEVPAGVTDNGTYIKLWDDNGLAPQRWYLIPTGDGWYKIAPKNDINKCMDVEGVSSANGSLVFTWDYLDGFNQQWKLTPVSTSSAPLTFGTNSSALKNTKTASVKSQTAS